jgi:murein DD-endopeptidase MepM/ murein hydrolase activator NlpD
MATTDRRIPDTLWSVRARSSRLAVALLTAALAALAVGFGASAADAPGPAPEGRAAGFALQIRIPGYEPITHAPALSRGGTANAGGGYATQPDPAIASVIAADTAVGVGADGAAARGDATVRTAGVTLLDGLVTASSTTTQAAAAAAPDREAQSGLAAQVTDLVVAGQPVEAAPNRVIVIDGVGDLVVGESVDAVRGPHATRAFAIALHLRLRQEYRGLPAGTEILVGYADTGAAIPDPTSLDSATEPQGASDAPAAVDPSDDLQAPSGGAYDTSATQDEPPGGFSDNPPIDPERQEQLLSGEYMFPVLGSTTADFSDDWGAPRATTGSHQGIDVFAPAGTPILAITDGTLFRVGWNTLGGRRLWLADRHGNLFYFAHLAGFSPLAKEGAQVRRGDVIGFVGTSGDAQGTPPHLHFQIHPGGGWAIPPFAYVTTWLTGVRQPVVQGAVTAPDPPNPDAAATTTAPPKPVKPKPVKPQPPATTAETPPASTEAAPFETLPVATTEAPAAPPATQATNGTGTVFDD